MDRLVRYPYPGNIRELKSIVESSLNLAQNRPIAIRHLPETVLERSRVNREACSEEDAPAKTLARVEKEHIVCTYKQTGRNKSKTARILGIGLNTLRRKLAAYGLK